MQVQLLKKYNSQKLIAQTRALGELADRDMGL
jgi:hypothetical protein